MTEDYKRGYLEALKEIEQFFENRAGEPTDAFLYGAVKMAIEMIRESFINDCKILEEQGEENEADNNN